MDGGILALDAIHGIENSSLNNSGQPARKEWVRAGIYVRLQKKFDSSLLPRRHAPSLLSRSQLRG